MLTFLYQFFKGIEVVTECLAAFFGGNVARVGFLADELLFDGNVILCLQRLGMAGQVAVGHAQQFLEGIEVGMLVHHQDAHDPEAYAVVKGLVDMLEDILQTYSLRSYL